MSDVASDAVRKMIQEARTNAEFARLLSVAPAHAVRHSKSLSETERRLLGATTSSWAPLVGGRPLNRGAQAGGGSQVIARINQFQHRNVAHIAGLGESLSDIAVQYTGDPDAVDAACALNGLTDDPRPGTVIQLPGSWAAQFGEVVITAASLNGTARAGARRRHYRRIIPSQPSRFRPELTHKLDIAGFITKLGATLQARGCAGYSMIISDGMQQIPQNYLFSRYPQDGVPYFWTTNTAMQVSSVSKLLTSMMIMNIAANTGFSLLTEIGNHVPSYWTFADSRPQVTLLQLLQHSAGFRGGGQGGYQDEFNYCRQQYGLYPSLLYNNQFSYADVNYAMLRIVVGSLTGATNGLDAMIYQLGATALDSLWNSISIESYALYMDGLFGSAGVTGRLGSEPTDALAYAYFNGQITAHGQDLGDEAGRTGEAGWYLSPSDVLAIVESYRSGSLIQNAANAFSPFPGGQPPLLLNSNFNPVIPPWSDGTPENLALCNYIGTDVGNEATAAGGAYIGFSKNGGESSPLLIPVFAPTSPASAAWLQTLVFCFPDATLVLFINSAVGANSADYLSLEEAGQGFVLTGIDPVKIVQSILPSFVS